MSFKLQKKDGTFTSQLSYANINVFDINGSNPTTKKFTIVDGTKSITENGTHDIASFEKVNVQVQAAGETTLEATYSGGDVPVGTDPSTLTIATILRLPDRNVTVSVKGATVSGNIQQGENILNVAYGGLSTTVTVRGAAPSPTGYTVTIPTITGMTLNVTHGDTVINNGDAVPSGDSIKIKATAMSEYTVTSVTVKIGSGNPQDIKVAALGDGATITVTAPIVIEATAEKEDPPTPEDYWTITYIHNGLLDTSSLPTKVAKGQSVTIAPKCLSVDAINALTKNDSAFAPACWSGNTQKYVCMRRVVGEWSYKIGSGVVTHVSPVYTDEIQSFPYAVSAGTVGTYTTTTAHPAEQSSSVTITPDGNVTVWVAPMVNLFGPTYSSGQVGNVITLTPNIAGSGEMTYWCMALSSGSISLSHMATDTTVNARLVTVDDNNTVISENEVGRLNTSYTAPISFSEYTKASWRFGSAGSGTSYIEQFLTHIGQTHFVASGV